MVVSSPVRVETSILIAALLLCAPARDRVFVLAWRPAFSSECLYGAYKPAQGNALEAGTCACQDGWFGLTGKRS